MGCRKYLRLMTFRDDEISLEERERLRIHLGTCVACAREAADVAAMQRELGRVRDQLPAAADPMSRVSRIMEAISDDRVTVHAMRTTSIIERSLQVLDVPAFRYAAAVLLIVIVGSGLWQGAEVMSEVEQFEAGRAMPSVAQRRLPAVRYAVDVRGHDEAFVLPMVRGARAGLVDGSLLLTAEEVETLRDLDTAPPTVLKQFGIPEEVVRRARLLQDDPEVRVRPILTYKNGTGA